MSASFSINKCLSFCLALFLIFGCTSSPRFTSVIKTNKSHNIPTKQNQKIEFQNNYSSSNNPIIKEAEKKLGIPYCYGGDSLNCFDCSGFVGYVYLSFGIVIPRTSQEQYDVSVKIPKGNEKPTDLVFFGSNKKVNHVGIYVGNNNFIHASTSKGVTYQSLDDEYFKKRFIGFGRIISDP